MKRQFFISYLLIIFSTIIPTLLIIQINVDDYAVNQYQAQYENDLLLLNELLVDTDDDYETFAEHYSELIDARITIIDSEGTVIADSTQDPKEMDNHINREEVVQAIETGAISHSLRQSTTLNMTYLYSVMPVEIQGETWFLRVSKSFSELEALMQTLWQSFISIFIIVGGLAVILAFVLSKKLSRPIDALTEGAKEIAEGNYDKKIYYKSDNQLGELTEAFNQMSATLKDTVSELNVANTELKSVLDNLGNGIIAVDENMKIMHLNDVSMKFFGLDENPVMRPVFEVIRDPNVISMIQECLLEGINQNKEIDYSSGQDYILKVSTNHIKLEDEDRIYGCVVTVEDVSEMVKLQKMRTDFVSNVSHELKTPLTSIKGFIETLNDGAIENPKIAKKFLNIIGVEADRLYLLINDVLTLSEIESIPYENKEEYYSLLNIVNDAYEVMTLKLSGQEIDFKVDVDNSLYLLCGYNRMKEVFINLISNAIKYSNCDKIMVNARLDDDKVIILFEDDGIGIDEEHLDRIFERFYRVDKSRKHMEGSTGLGLAIVKHTVKLYGGEIKAYSNDHQGTTFRIEMYGKKES